MANQFPLITLLGFGGFLALTMLIGLYANKKQKNQSTTDSFLAQKSLPFWVGLFTLTATWVGGGYLAGTCEQVYENGILWTQAPWGYGLSLMLGGFLFSSVHHNFYPYTNRTWFNVVLFLNSSKF